ncbi:hypothetical protein ABQD63_04045 [Lactococcus garvieae]|uniref:hypothetical protein n=1 Tax=Lactococcus TaxID=1357 RepID=UPI0025505A5C|nr:hypothetical protein [Lactococcus petauri]
MEELQLTKDSKELLAIIYKEYLSKISNGMSKRQAKIVGHADTVCALAPEWLPEDVVETMWELGRSGYLKNTPADNTVYFSVLQDKAILYFENKNINTVKSIAEWALKLI